MKYLHKQSNHNPSIIKQLPLSVERRLSKLPLNDKIFNDLHIPGSTNKSRLQPQVKPETWPEKDNSQQRKRQIIWFNPPYSKNFTTEVGNFLLSLIEKHVPPHNKLHKLFNWKNVKIIIATYQI